MRRYGGIAILVVCAAFLGLLKLFETPLTYPLDPTPISPAQAGVVMDAVTMTGVDGAQIVLWHAAPAAGQPLVLYFPGNAGNLGNRAARFRLFQQAGLGVLAMAYRGANGSEGTPSEAAIRADALQMIALAQARHPGTRLVYYGESLGTGVAAWLATQSAPARLVLEAPFTSIPDAAIKGTAPRWVVALFANHWDTRHHIEAVSAPLLVLHGVEDAVVPVDQGEAVFAAAASADKRFVRLENVGHHDVWQPEVQRDLLGFLSAR